MTTLEYSANELTSSSDPSSRPSIPGYEILEELGRGNMGVVYKARQTSLHRHVALKMILPGNGAGQDAMQRFVTEARVVASLKHPNIVQIYEINLEQDSPYFSMELVEGGTLADRILGCPQPVHQAAFLLLTLARTIHVAHQNGIVHRDLKPTNILLSSADPGHSTVHRMAQELGLYSPELSLGVPKITDFGLAKQIQAELGRTESGIIMGTPGYMAPEQAEGKSRDVGPAADIYALGAIFYELLTGRPPFAAESAMETFMLLFQAEPIPPSRLRPKVPRDLETICLKCLDKDPHRRYPSAEALANDLQRFLNGEPIQARPPSLCEVTWKWTRRRPALATLVGCAVLGVMSFLGILLWHHAELQARLGQALEDEREARLAEETAQLHGKVKSLLHAGEAAIAARDWRNAQAHLTSARDQAADHPELATLRADIDRLLQQTHQQRQDHQRLQDFRRRRNDTLFQATLYTGSDLISALEETRRTALEALHLFAVTPDTTTGPAINSPYYTEREKAEIVSACYELLIILADAVAQPLPDQTPADRRRQAEEALGILDRAGRLGVTTRAYHRRREHYLTLAGQSEAALQASRQASDLHPSTPLDHFLLGQEHYRHGELQKAVLAFESALQKQPDHFWASYYLALCSLKTRRPDQAVARLTACLGQHRDFPWLYLLRASAWGELNQFTRALEDFEAALKLPLSDAARYGLLINRGVLRIRQGQLDSARADLQKAIALRPQLYQGYVNLAQAHLKGQQLNEAVAQLDQAIRREPKLASLYRTRARLHLLRHDHAAALADLDRVIALAADAAPAVLAEDHLERARLLHRQKDDKQAVQACDAALRLCPRDARIYRLRAEALLGLNRLDDALQSLDDCLQYGPPDAGAFRARAALRTRRGEYADAQADYTRALEIAPDAATHAARGWCFLVADAPKLALPDFEEAIRLSPEQGEGYAGRGYVRALLGASRLAVADAEEALRRGPRSSRLCYNVARIYAQALTRQDSGSSRRRATDKALRKDWQERARQSLTRSLDLLPPHEATRFWHTVVQSDPALNSLRGTVWFRQLANRFPLKRVYMESGTAL